MAKKYKEYRKDEQFNKDVEEIEKLSKEFDEKFTAFKKKYPLATDCYWNISARNTVIYLYSPKVTEEEY